MIGLTGLNALGSPRVLRENEAGDERDTHKRIKSSKETGGKVGFRHRQYAQGKKVISG